MPFFVSFSQLVSAILPCCTQRWCRTMFRCLSVFILHSMMHYDSPPVACPVLFCSAPSLFPFHWRCPSFPPLSLCCGIHLIFFSLAGQGATQAEEKEAGMSNCVLCWYSWTIPSDFFFSFFFLLLLLLLLQFSILAAYNKRWQSMGSNSEVGT